MQSYCYCLGFKRLIAVTCTNSVGGLYFILNYVCLCLCGRLHSHSSVCILYKPCNFLNTFNDWMVFLVFWVFKMGLILGFSQNLMLSPLTFSSFQHCVNGYSNFIYLCNSMFIWLQTLRPCYCSCFAINNTRFTSPIEPIRYGCIEDSDMQIKPQSFVGGGGL
jgi:hypothetical protein